MEAFDLLWSSWEPNAPVELTPIRVRGESSESARDAIVRALHEVGHGYEGETGFSLLTRAGWEEERSWSEQEPVAPESDRFLLDRNATLGDLRAVIGPDDAAVVLSPAGFGGGADEIWTWVFSDLKTVSQAILDSYGAVEIARACGRALRARHHRQTREDADYWVMTGKGDVTDSLREAVMTQRVWRVTEAERAFDLTKGDLVDLFTACGYEYVVFEKSFYQIGFLDSLNE